MQITLASMAFVGLGTGLLIPPTVLVRLDDVT